MLQRSLPGALIVVLYVMLIQSLGPALGFTEAQSSTLSVYLTGIANLTLLWRVCWPLNAMRGTLCLLMTAGFFAAAHLFRSLIGLTAMSGAMWPVCLVFALCCLPLMLLIEKALKKWPRLRK